MRIGAIVLIVAAFFTACTHLDLNRNMNALKRIEVGDTVETVARIMGPPDISSEITDRRMILYYQTAAATSADAAVTPAMCTAVAFEDGRVVAIGEDLADEWAREAEESARQAQIAERERRQNERAADARRRAEAERRQKIAELEKEVKPIPVHQADLNLKLYRQLLELDPRNPRYQKKVAFYEARLEQQVKARQERSARDAQQKQLEEWGRNREARNQQLRQYSGNGIAEMAVHDMGPGALYVWVKNVSMQIITTHPDHFTLIDSNGREVVCQISASLDSVLEPGSISHGKIEYDKGIIPRELLFRNRESGRISKRF